MKYGSAVFHMEAGPTYRSTPAPGPDPAVIRHPSTRQARLVSYKEFLINWLALHPFHQH